MTNRYKLEDIKDLIRINISEDIIEIFTFLGEEIFCMGYDGISELEYDRVLIENGIIDNMGLYGLNTDMLECDEELFEYFKGLVINELIEDYG